MATGKLEGRLHDEQEKQPQSTARWNSPQSPVVSQQI